MKNFRFLVVLLLASACSTMKVAYDYDKQVDFSVYTTYNYSEDALKLPVGDFNRQRILTAIDNEMTTRGISKSDKPDILVDLHLKAQKEVEATATTTGTPWRYGYGGGFATTQVSYNTYVEGTLFIFLVDAATQKIVWQGTGTKTLEEDLKPEEREESINYSIKQIMANYPPPK